MVASTAARMGAIQSAPPARFANTVQGVTALFAAVPILAHQGGWDEVMLIAGPMVVIAGLLVLAKRRVDKLAAGGPATNEHTTDH